MFHFIFIFASLLSVGLTLPHDFIRKPSGEPLEAHLIGTTSDGKNFYTESTLRDWWEAREYCLSQGLEFAEIETKIQKDFLQQAPIVNHLGSFWTAGRDAHMLRQLDWDGSKTVVDDNIFGTFDVRIEYQTCFKVEKQTNGWYKHMRLCTDKYQTLCQHVN